MSNSKKDQFKIINQVNKYLNKIQKNLSCKAEKRDTYLNKRKVEIRVINNRNRG